MKLFLYEKYALDFTLKFQQIAEAEIVTMKFEAFHDVSQYILVRGHQDEYICECYQN